MTKKELIGTRWQLNEYSSRIPESEVEFQNQGKLILRGILDLKNNWIISDDKLVINYNNEYVKYTGSFDENTITGHARNKFDKEWEFKMELKKNIPVSNSTKINSNGQKKKVKSEEIYKKKKHKYIEILKRHNISTLYHFTDKSNIESIKKHGALFSWQYCVKNNIEIPMAGGDKLSRKLDRRYQL